MFLLLPYVCYNQAQQNALETGYVASPQKRATVRGSPYETEVDEETKSDKRGIMFGSNSLPMESETNVI